MTRLSALVASAFAGALLAACFSPQSGDYDIEPDGDLNTDCPESDTGANLEAEETTAEIEVNEDKDEMEVTFEDSTETLDCYIEGHDFDCEPIAGIVDYSSYGMSAVVTITSTVEGEWTSNTSFDGTSTLDFLCVGADCSTFGGWADCSADWDYTGELD